jgi:hypothetical protein
MFAISTRSFKARRGEAEHAAIKIEFQFERAAQGLGLWAKPMSLAREGILRPRRNNRRRTSPARPWLRRLGLHPVRPLRMPLGRVRPPWKPPQAVPQAPQAAVFNYASPADEYAATFAASDPATHWEIIPRRPDSLADEPVVGEPVSGRNLPAFNENAGRF